MVTQNNKIRVHCGFSANLEIQEDIDPTEFGDKNETKGGEMVLSGSTFNIYKCLSNMNQMVHPIFLAAYGNGDGDDRLRAMYKDAFDSYIKDLRSSKTKCSVFRVLKYPNYTTIKRYTYTMKPVTDVHKGEIIKSYVPSIVKAIDKFEDVEWVVNSGAQIQEEDLIKALLKKGQKGKRVLIPKSSLVANSIFNKILQYVDYVQMTMEEFRAYDGEPEDLLAQGPSILVLTNAENPGKVYYKGGHFDYDPVCLKDRTLIGTIGAGDWFCGACITYCLENNWDMLFSENDLERIKLMISFASEVAGKKVLCRGGSVGPKRSDISL